MGRDSREQYNVRRARVTVSGRWKPTTRINVMKAIKTMYGIMIMIIKKSQGTLLSSTLDRIWITRVKAATAHVGALAPKPAA